MSTEKMYTFSNQCGNKYIILRCEAQTSNGRNKKIKHIFDWRGTFCDVFSKIIVDFKEIHPCALLNNNITTSLEMHQRQCSEK